MPAEVSTAALATGALLGTLPDQRFANLEKQGYAPSSMATRRTRTAVSLWR